MPERVCQTCKHFEPSTARNKGWCRNPALYAPHQSHAVAPDSLDCSRRHGNFWEASPSMNDEPDGTERQRHALGSRPRLRLFQPPAQLVPAPAGMFASFGRGDDGGNRDDPRTPGRSSGGGLSSRTPGTGSGASTNRPGLSQGQERTVSYQPEERYWTDYLRIALPIAGLLLMLALFWFWADSIIGNNSGDQPTAKPQATTIVMTATVPAPTATTNPKVTAEVVQPTPTTGADTGQPTAGPNETPTDTPAAEANPTPPGNGFRVGDIAVVSEAGDGATLRTDASTSADSLGNLAAGDEVEIKKEATKKKDGHYWVYVTVNSGNLQGQEGYVADDLLQPSSSQ